MTGGDNPGANFNGIGRQMQIDFGCQPYSISFDITPNTLNSSVSKVIIVEEFVGGSWVALATYTWNGSVATPIGLGSLGAPATLSQTLIFNPSATSVRFNMTVRDAGVGNSYWYFAYFGRCISFLLGAGWTFGRKRFYKF